MDRWNNRVALVTGASCGIGAAICCELVKYGMKVVGCARDVQRIRDLAEEEVVKKQTGFIFPIKCDLTREEDISAMFETIRKTFQRIDVCINNAGLSFDCPLLSGTTAEWRTMLNVNVLALCICNREAVKLMREKNIDDGQIINISSMSGHRICAMSINLYCGTKFMVRALTEGLRRELKAANTHIRVASISPGLVETEFEFRCYREDPDKAKGVYESIECMQPEDIAKTVTFVLSTHSRVDVNDVLIRPVEQED